MCKNAKSNSTRAVQSTPKKCSGTEYKVYPQKYSHRNSRNAGNGVLEYYRWWLSTFSNFLLGVYPSRLVVRMTKRPPGPGRCNNSHILGWKDTFTGLLPRLF